MGKRRPPDILRKSHAHTEGDERARSKRELREALDDAVSGENEGQALLIRLEGVVCLEDMLVPGADAAVRWLVETGIRYLFITQDTATPAGAIAERLADLGLEVDSERFRAISGKPAAAFFGEVLGELGAVAARSAMIGDDIRRDIAPAQAAGLKGILARTGRYRRVDPGHGIEPDLVIDSFADLPGAWAELASS